MSLRDIRLTRPITSYNKVQFWIGDAIRGKKIGINRKRVKNKVLLNVGCGPHPKEEFINLDYRWHPQIDVCWDIVKKGYPFDDNSLEGIFTEHCLEHIPFESCQKNLKEFYRMLKPGGILRIVVPDGELYCDLYNKRKSNRTVVLPYGENEASAMIGINRIFRNHQHLFIYDFETFQLLLEKAGFTHIKKLAFGIGSDERLLIDRPERAIESLYLEAIK